MLTQLTSLGGCTLVGRRERERPRAFELTTTVGVGDVWWGQIPCIRAEADSSGRATLWYAGCQLPGLAAQWHSCRQPRQIALITAMVQLLPHSENCWQPVQSGFKPTRNGCGMLRLDLAHMHLHACELFRQCWLPSILIVG